MEFNLGKITKTYEKGKKKYKRSIFRVQEIKRERLFPKVNSTAVEFSLRRYSESNKGTDILVSEE